MSELGPDDPLVRSTTRLSISTMDVENENPRHQVAEFLRSEYKGRRDSAVSLNSFNDDDDENDTNHLIKMGPPPKGDKRRRSSAQSFSYPATTTTNGVKNGNKSPKKEKVHKKKLKKATSSPELELSPTDGTRLAFKMLRDLVIQVYTGKVVKKEKWFSLANPGNVSSVVFCLVPGIPIDKVNVDTERLKDNSSYVPLLPVEEERDLNFANNFGGYIKTSSPGSKESIYSPLQTITSIQLTKNEKKELLDKSKATKITINDLLLTEEQLHQYNYPTRIDDSQKDVWAETKDFEHEGSRTFALDCEFCQSAAGKVLTRISLINFQGEVVIDLLVKPEEEITDYLTKYSGITEHKLKDVTTNLKEVQEKILSIVSSDDILIGHSLESDLNVMKIKHSKIVDTAIIYEHTRGPPSKPSLKWLASKFLVRTIQAGENDGKGHSSVEDAQACLDLVKLKIIEGSCFGLNVGDVSIFQRLAREATPSHKTRGIEGSKFSSLWINYSHYKEQETYVEPSDHHVARLYASNDDDVVSIFNQRSVDKNFTVLSLRELEFVRGWSTSPDHYTGAKKANPDDENYEQALEDAYAKTNYRLNEIYQSLPENAMMIVHATVGSPNEMFRLQEVKRNFQRKERDGEDVTKLPKEEVWDTNKQQALFEACNIARESVAFIGIKKSAPPSTTV